MIYALVGALLALNVVQLVLRQMADARWADDLAAQAADAYKERDRLMQRIQAPQTVVVEPEDQSEVEPAVDLFDDEDYWKARAERTYN